MRLFDRWTKLSTTFSTRAEEDATLRDIAIPPRARTVVLQHMFEIFGRLNFANENWSNLYRELCLALERNCLSKGQRPPPQQWYDDLDSYLGRVPDSEFPTLVEVFLLNDLFRSRQTLDAATQFVQIVNNVMRRNEVPLQLTQITRPDYPYHDPMFIEPQYEIVNPARFYRSPDNLIVEHAYEPALDCLDAEEFRLADRELRDALDHHREGRLHDCLTSCSSALESVTKVCLSKLDKPTRSGDSRERRALLQELGLHASLEKPMEAIAAMRNKLGSAHGAGVETRTPSRHETDYVIALTMASIVLLIDSTDRNR